MDAICTLMKWLKDGSTINLSDNVKCTKITSHNHNNDDYHIFINEDLQNCPLNFRGNGNLINKITKERHGKYCVQLHRPTVFQNTILRVLKESSRYGISDIGNGKKVFINVPSSLDLKNRPLDDLRSLYLASHLEQLLFANSYEVDLIPFENTFHIEKCIKEMLLEKCVTTNNNSDETDVAINHSKKDLLILDWFMTVKCNLKNHKNKCKLLENDKNTYEILNINLNKFVEDEGLAQKFSANINSMILTSDDKNTKQLYHLEDAAKIHKMAMGFLPVTCIHVTNNKNYLQQQKIEVAWRVINDDVNSSVSQLHFLYSRAHVDDLNNVEQDPIKLFRSRKSQIATAFKSKYGLKRAAFFTDEMMEQMAQASLRFEFLSIKPTLETKISHQNSCFEDRSGVFIFYNYARISTLLDKFEKLVEEGVNLPLMTVEKMDFSSLKQEEEWRVLFNYVLEYPNVVRDSITIDVNGGIKSITTQKICQFLSGLSNCFSKYYSKTHILTDPLPHLIMTMHSRLYLVKAVKQVYDNALNILSIRPLQRL